MAPRDATKASTVFSKTTPKAILKKGKPSEAASSTAGKGDGLAKKIEALEESRRKAAGNTPAGSLRRSTAMPASQAALYATMAAGKTDENADVNPSNAPKQNHAQTSALTSTNWRTPAPIPESNLIYEQVPRPQALTSGPPAMSTLEISNRSILGVVSGNQPQGAAQSVFVSNGDRPTDRFHSVRDYEAGVIFSTATHQQDYNRLVPGNMNQSVTRLGVVYSKFRKFVVIARHKQHVLALPIYTHEGKGLANKDHKNEFVSIRDVDLKEQAAGPESIHDVVWAERYPSFKSSRVPAWHMMSNTTSVHFTAPYSHSMDVKCTISGEMTETSLKYLQNLFKESLTAAFSVEKQAKPVPDADGFTTIRIAPSRAGSTQYRQRPQDSAYGRANSWRPPR